MASNQSAVCTGNSGKHGIPLVLGLDLDERVLTTPPIPKPAQAVSLKGAVPNSVFADCPPMHGKGGWWRGKPIVTDSTYVKANASRQSEHVVEVEKAACGICPLDEYEQVERTRLENAGKLEPAGNHS